MKLDFHVHTMYSDDSLIRPEDLIRKSKKLGIIPALTDHSSIQCHERMRSLGARFIPGEEVFTDNGDLIGLYINELIPKGTPFLEAVDRIHQQGGIAYLPHMYDYGRAKRHSNDKDAAKVDVIEVFNARCMKQEYNDRALKFAQENRLLMAASSDSHFLMEFGTTYTQVPEFDINDPKALLKALRKATFVTKKAPLYVRGTTTILSKGKKIFRAISRIVQSLRAKRL